MTSHDVDGIVIVSPAGPLHEGIECDRLEGALQALLLQGVRHVVVNLAEAGHLSARAVGVLARAHADAELRGLRVAISNPRPDHRQMFDITGLAAVLDLRPSDTAAIAALAGRDVAA